MLSTPFLEVSLKKLQRTSDNEHKRVGFLPVYRIEDEVKKERGSKSDDIPIYGFRSCTTAPLEKSYMIPGF